MKKRIKGGGAAEEDSDDGAGGELVQHGTSFVTGRDGKGKKQQPWEQEVTDAQGRRRFHGAFTGGFSAGYYNTVGSLEGWAPQQFVSSRSHRNVLKQSRPEGG
jgi:G patch domain-containing protein 1